MARNVKKEAEKAKGFLSARRELSVEEIQEIANILNQKNDDSILDAITTAFYFGVYVGASQQSANDKAASSAKEQKGKKDNGK